MVSSLKKLKESLLANAGYSRGKAAGLKEKTYTMLSGERQAGGICQYFL